MAMRRLRLQDGLLWVVAGLAKVVLDLSRALQVKSSPRACSRCRRSRFLFF